MKKILPLILILAAEAHPKTLFFLHSVRRTPSNESPATLTSQTANPTSEDDEELDPLALSQRPRPSPQPSAAAPSHAAASAPRAPSLPCAGAGPSDIQPSPLSDSAISLPFVTHLPSWITDQPEPPAAAAKPKEPELRPCPTQHEFVTQGKIKLSRFSSRTQKDFCVVRAGGFVDAIGTTRAVSWNSEGGFSVVIFLDREGNASANSYARTVYHLPRLRPNPDFTINADGGATFHLVNGERMKMNPEVRISTYTGGKLELANDTPIRLEDQGGIRIHPTTGVFIDFGWQRGKLPVEVKTRDAVISDSRGNSCTLKNTELLRYVPLPSGALSHVELLHRTDAELAQFLHTRCPTIDVKDLEHSQ
jgi:hypothetical protein